MIMTDQDHDGSHIKGLIMNFLHHFYPSLLRIEGFLLEFITPIVKARAPPGEASQGPCLDARWIRAPCLPIMHSQAHLRAAG